jgi:membrane-anchored protein YejM (alkaline phosphatase superfamily)
MVSRRTKTLIFTSVLIPLGRMLYSKWQQRKEAERNKRRFPVRGIRRRG